MTFPNIIDYNQSAGIQTIFVYINDVTNGAFINLLLLGLFLILSLFSYFVSKKSIGQGNFMGSLTASAFVTAGASIILSSINGLITANIVMLWAVITLISLILWVFSKD